MKSNMIAIMVSLTVVMFCFGCSAKKQMYCWGDYSDTLYQSKKDPCVESIAKHKEELEKIIEESENQNLRMPPGVCAELGYLYANNNTKKAIELFQMEKQTYPESTILMERLILLVEKRSLDDDSSKKTSVEKFIEQENSIEGRTNE